MKKNDCLTTSLTTMSKYNANALDVLAEVMKQRNWYGDTLERRQAANYKNLLKKGILSYEKACQILNQLGFRKVTEETWEK